MIILVLIFLIILLGVSGLFILRHYRSRGKDDEGRTMGSEFPQRNPGDESENTRSSPPGDG
jgi:hypothetical protein